MPFGAFVTSSPMLVISRLTLITLAVTPPPCLSRARSQSQAKSPGANCLGSTSTSQLPETSRMTASTP